MSRPGDPRKTHRYQVSRAKYLQQHTACSICGLPLDFEAAPNTRWYPTVDHTLALVNGGDPYDWRNWQPAHHGCNSRKGNREMPRSPRSRRW